MSAKNGVTGDQFTEPRATISEVDRASYRDVAGTADVDTVPSEEGSG